MADKMLQRLSTRITQKSIAFLSLLLIAFTSAHAKADVRSNQHRRKGPVVPGQFVVTLAASADPEVVLRRHGLRADRVYRHAMRGFAGKISAAMRSRLLADTQVIHVEEDQVITTATLQQDAPWGLDRIDQRGVALNQQYTFDATGAGVTVYVIDTGIRFSHQDFAGRARFGFDSFGGDGVDCDGHGTHVAGTIGGSTYGVAKNVDLVAVRVLDCSGSGTISGVIAGIDWVTKNHKAPAVANLSLGGGASYALDVAVQKMIFAGVATAVAAGNDTQDACFKSPARVSEAMTIGATNSTDTRASWSNYGKCVDWFAPGVQILSASNSSDTATAIMSGTSMASPHTAGVAALYLERHPTDSPVKVRDALLGFTSKGVVLSSRSTNNHLLFASEFPDGAGDYTSPVTTISAPSDGSTVARRAKLTVRATASDNMNVQRVEFYVNGLMVCSDRTAPYTCSYTAPRTAGLIQFQTKAFDAAGNVGTSRFVVIQVR